jgi:hypothetical protein
VCVCMCLCMRQTERVREREREREKEREREILLSSRSSFSLETQNVKIVSPHLSACRYLSQRGRQKSNVFNFTCLLHINSLTNKHRLPER